MADSDSTTKDKGKAPRSSSTTAHEAVTLEPDTTYVVGHPDGEVEFKTDGEGRFTPSNEKEAWAANELGNAPGKE